MIVMGDHGMTLTGGHGGTSPRESHVPLLIFPSNRSQFKTIPRQRMVFEQVDVVPTLASLLHVCIPISNLGVSALPIFLKPGPATNEMLEQNAQQLAHLISDSDREGRPRKFLL